MGYFCSVQLKISAVGSVDDLFRGMYAQVSFTQQQHCSDTTVQAATQDNGFISGKPTIT